MINLKKLFLTTLDRLESETPSYLKYHNAAHTRQVIQSVEIIAAAENVSDRDLKLLRVAALFHDIGYLQNREEHEALSCEEARKVLPEYGFGQNEIDKICGMIMATKIPQMPNNHLEKIMADADLEYIGTEHYEKGSDLLFTEMKHFSPNLDAKEWHKLKIEFLEQHQFQTDFCINSRESNKAENLRRLKFGQINH